MRICFVTGEYPPMQGGVGDCTRELGRALLQLGHQVIVLTSTKAAVPETLQDAGPSSRAQMQAQSRHLPGEAQSRHLPDEYEPAVRPVIRHWGWRSWAQILQTAHENGSDVLHVQYQTGAFGMHPAVNFLPLRLRLTRNRPRVVFTFHDLRVPYLFPKAGMVRRWVTLFPGRWSDAVIATNEEDYEQLKLALGQVQDGLRCIPIGSNIHPQLPPGYDRRVWRQGLGVAENEVLLCYFGFLNESKGGETLFRSLSELRRRGYPAKLLMIGGQVGDSDPTNVAYFERVKSLSQELDLTDWILWTGFTKAELVSANFMAADVCVLPYRDGISFRRGSFMAALAHGLPIVSTRARQNAGGTLPCQTHGETAPRQNAGETSPRLATRTLVDGANILLVPMDDPEAIAEAVGRLISNPELCTRLSHGALDLAKSFTWDHIASQTASLYAESHHLSGEAAVRPH